MNNEGMKGKGAVIAALLAVAIGWIGGYGVGYGRGSHDAGRQADAKPVDTTISERA